MQPIETFLPSCVVCRSPVPAARAHSRSRETCSAACALYWRQYHRYVLMQTRCPSCYHPSTPEERADFKRWRKSRGDLRDKVGRPPKKKVLTS